MFSRSVVRPSSTSIKSARLSTNSRITPIISVGQLVWSARYINVGCATPAPTMYEKSIMVIFFCRESFDSKSLVDIGSTRKCYYPSYDPPVDVRVSIIDQEHLRRMGQVSCCLTFGESSLRHRPLPCSRRVMACPTPAGEDNGPAANTVTLAGGAFSSSLPSAVRLRVTDIIIANFFSFIVLFL